MAKGSEIVLSADPRGVFMEGTIDDTSKPGTWMEMVPAAADIGGRPHYRARSRTAGVVGPLFLLLPDELQGKIATAAYVSGTRCFLYAPLPGEEVNALLKDVVGTGDIVTAGDLFGITADGKLIANSSYASTPCQARETLAALTADTLLWCLIIQP